MLKFHQPDLCCDPNRTTLVIVEQDIRQAMAVSDRVYYMREGRIVLEGPPSELGREELTKAYFGI